MQINPMCEEFRGGWKKLWENPNPNASMTSQDIILSSGDYDLLLIVYHYLSVVSAYESFICPKGLTALIEGTDISNQSVYSRNLNYVNDTKLTASSGYVRNTAGGASNQNDMYAIPITIYGIKFQG